MQHGEAMAGEVDPDRPLSEAGRASVAGVAGHAAARGVRIDRIVHSGKLRAEQSAALLAEATGCTDVRARAGLGPKESVDAAAGTLIDAENPGALAIVGHLPFLDRLASLLVTGDAGGHVIAFRNGGLVRLLPRDGAADTAPGPAAGQGPAGRFTVAWILTPELVGPPS